MALTLVGTSSNGGNAQNPTCTIPTGTTTGDLMVCQWSTGAAVHTSPTGWTDELQTGTSSMITYYIWKIADSGDTPGASRTFSQGGTTPTRLAITTYRGDFDTSNPIDVTGFISTGSSASITSPSTTTPAAGWVVESAGVRGGTSYTSSPPAGYVEIYDTTTSSGSPAKAATAMYDGASGTLDLLGSGVSIGGHAFTASASVAAGEQHSHTVFIRQLATVGPITPTFTATASIPVDFPGPLHPDVHNPAVTIYQSHRGGADILPPETMTAYTNSVNNRFSLEGDIYMLMNSGSDTTDDRMALTHDADLASIPLYLANGTTVVSGATADITTTSITTWDGTPLKIAHPITGNGANAVAVSRWKHLAEYMRQDTGGGAWPLGRMAAIENKASGSLTPIIDSVTARGLTHFVLANSFDYSRCVTMAAAGLHVMWLTTSFATNSAATVAAAGIEWVGWQAGTAGFSTFLSQAHAAGLYVNVYDVQTSSQRDTYTSQGVEMISTDRPDLVYPSTAWTGDAAVTATATIAAAGSLGRTGAAAQTASVSIAADGVIARSGAAAQAVTATIAGAGVKGVSTADNVAVTTTVAADGLMARSSAANQTATATIAADGLRAATGAAAQAATATIAANGTRAASSAAPQNVSVAITAAGAVTSSSGSSADQTATATIAAAGRAGYSGTGNQSPTVTLAGAGTLAKSGAASQTASVAIAAAGDVETSIGAEATQNIAADVAAGGTLGKSDAVPITLAVSIAADGTVTKSTASDVGVTVTVEAAGLLGRADTPTQTVGVDIDAEGLVFVGGLVPPTPPERIVTIRAQSRVKQVAREERAVNVTPHPRVLEVPHA